MPLAEAGVISSDLVLPRQHNGIFELFLFSLEIKELRVNDIGAAW